MAVADDLGVPQDYPQQPAFDRQPPQDIAAEQAVLGGMLLSKDAIADVVEVLRGNDFYRPAHQAIYETVLDLYGRGEPADPVTVSAELTRTGQLMRVGGAPYLHTLMSSVPTAANAGYYARIVAEQAVLRRLIEAGTRIVQLGYGAASGDGGEIDEVVDRAQAAVYEVTEQRTSEDYVRLEQLLTETMDEIDLISSHGGVSTGVPTGFADLDGLTNGLHPGQMIIIAARPALGKALALDTPLPTPTGWTTMGEVQVGDALLGADGRPTIVLAATEVMRDRPCYEVEFSDGEIIVADAEHLWQTTTRASRRQLAASRPSSYHWTGGELDHLRTVAACSLAQPDRLVSVTELLTDVGAGFEAALRGRIIRDLSSAGRQLRPATRTVRDRTGRATADYEFPVPVYSRHALLAGLLSRAARPRAAARRRDHNRPVTTREIAASVRCPDRRFNHLVEQAAPLQLPHLDLPLTPYLLGVWLGDGHSASARLTSADPEIADHLRRLGTVQGRLRELGVLGNKHIPVAYLRASEGQRRDLLAGLLDTDGTVTGTGNVQFTSTDRRLAADVRELVVSLGYRCGLSERRVAGRAGRSVAYTITFTTPDEVFRLSRKREAHLARRGPRYATRTAGRYIVAVRSTASVPVRCVQVDSADHLYLAGRSMIPTHNSTLALDLARAAAIKNGESAVIFSLEMSRTEITMRLLSAEAKVPLHHMRSGRMSDEDWARLARRMGEVAEAPLYIDDSPNLTLMEIRAKARRLKQRHNLRLVVVDYLQLMNSGRRVESRQQEVSEFSRALKLLAKELEVPVVALSQLNRGPEQRTDKKPMLSDLRESGSLEQDADMVILLHREDAYERESPRAGEADLILAKNRNGPTGTVTVAFQGHYSRFVDMQQGG